MRTVTLRLDDDLHKKFKLYSVETEEKMQDILVRILKDELEKDKKEK